MKKLILTVGLPRSGKSTWAKRQGFPIVNPDSIRSALLGQMFYARAEPFVWAIAKLMVRALFTAGHNCVILDATNVTKVRRNEWIDGDWGVEYRVFDVPAEECKRRAEKDERKDLIPVIEKMVLEWEAP